MIDINKKEDILIPFNKIGDKDWEVNTQEIIESVAENWSKNIAKPITEEDILSLEKRLGTLLPDSLKLFYKTFGIADIGEQLQPFSEIGWIKDIWAEYPQYGPDFTDKDNEHLPYLISFSDYLGNGNMFCFHSETKEIFYFDHDTRPYLTKLFAKVDDYIKGCLIFAQNDLFGEAGQEEVEKWTEEIVTDLFGREVVEKWRY